MKKQQGFTLVELVIVIVILGILAVTAAPKFLNLAGDAKAGTLNAVKASLQSANAEVYSKAILQGKQALASGAITNPSVATAYGYTAATTAAMAAVLDVDAADFTIYAAVDGVVITNGPSGAVTLVAATDVLIRPTSSTAITANTADACALVYRQAASAGAKPTYILINSGC